MKLVDDLIKKIGNDKLLHFLVGFCISAVVLLFYIKCRKTHRSLACGM